MEELSFMETFKLARKNNIMTAKLNVAEEVNGMFDFNEDQKEQLCKLVYEAYLASENLEPVHFCLAINGLLQNEKTLQDILEMNEYDLIEDASYYY